MRPGRSTTSPGDNRQKYTLDIEFRCPEAQQNTRGRNNRNGGNGNNNNNNNGNSNGAQGGSRGGNA